MRATSERSKSLLPIAVMLSALGVAGCVSDVEISELPGESTGVNEAAVVANWAGFESQYVVAGAALDECQGVSGYYTLCWAASVAMARYDATLGASAPSAQWVLDKTQSLGYVSGCTGGNATDVQQILDANSGSSWVGGGAIKDAHNYCNSTYPHTVDQLATELSNGTRSGAVLQGSAAGGQLGPCGWNTSGGHSIYVRSYDPATNLFTVYDPDAHLDSSRNFTRCGSSKTVSNNSDTGAQVTASYTAKWTKSQVKRWSSGFGSATSGYLCVITVDSYCSPGTTRSCESPKGCLNGRQTCNSSGTAWSSCAEPTSACAM